jgi:FG-GAP-like repeat/ASPIC and UnbV
MKKYTWAGLITIVIICLLIGLVFKRKNQLDLEKKTFLYNQGMLEVKDPANPFCIDAQIRYYDSIEILASLSTRQLLITRFLKAMALLKMGQEAQAVDILEILVKVTGANPGDKFALACKKSLALAYLRLGERNNCIAGHMTGSCIFPIQGSGLYNDLKASQQAISVFQEILQKDTGDLESRWLLNLAYMTIGQYPDKVPGPMLIPGLNTDTSAEKINAFVDMAGDLKLNSNKNMAGGIIVDDFDNDGNLDIVTSEWGLQDSMHFYRNNGDGTFSDLSVRSGLSQIKGGLNIIQADYNNDGYTDILVLRGAWLGEFGMQPKTLLRNNGDGTFTDVTVESGIMSFAPSQTAVWADFNNDGWVDLFIGNESTGDTSKSRHPSELYINNHDGTFTSVAAQAGCEMTAFIKGVTVADYNNDGWPDIFVSDFNGHRRLFKNKGVQSKIPQFADATHEAGLDRDTAKTFPTWFWDYNNDGWPDIFICGYQFFESQATAVAAEALHRPPPPDASTMYLYRNNHDGTFTDVSKGMGLDKPVFAMGANFGDIDNDGWPDMYLGTGNPLFTSLVPNKLFKNIGGKRFDDVTNSARVGNLQKGHGIAFADIDNDGDQDIFLVAGGAYPGDGYYNSLYINPGQNNNAWIGLQLEGTKSNRSAIGARIAVSFKEDSNTRTVYTDVNSGGSFGSSPLRKEIGIGKARIIDEIKITWPGSGTVQVFKNIAPRQFLKIKEGDPHIETLNLKTIKFSSHQEHMDMNMTKMTP